MSRCRCATDEAGTSLIEVLAALAITGLLAGLFLPFVSQILTRWTTGLERSQRSDQVMRAWIRLQRDVSAAAPLDAAPRGTKQASLAFAGDAQSCRFTRLAAEEGGLVLQSITLALDDDAKGTALVRRSTPYDPGRFAIDPPHRGSGATVISGNYRMHFSYVSRDGSRTELWTETSELPASIELSVRSFDGRALLPVPLSLVLPTPPQRRLP